MFRSNYSAIDSSLNIITYLLGSKETTQATENNTMSAFSAPTCGKQTVYKRCTVLGQNAIPLGNWTGTFKNTNLQRPAWAWCAVWSVHFCPATWFYPFFHRIFMKLSEYCCHHVIYGIINWAFLPALWPFICKFGQILWPQLFLQFSTDFHQTFRILSSLFNVQDHIYWSDVQTLSTRVTTLCKSGQILWLRFLFQFLAFVYSLIDK